MNYKLLFLLFIFQISLICPSFSISFLNKNDVIKIDSSVYKRKYFTKHIIAQPPKIDGLLNDNCWNEIGWSNYYVQQNPKEAATASQRTQLKVLYDDKNIYVAFFCHDSVSSKIHAYTSKRDEMNGDIVGVCFDSYFDHKTGFEFDMTAGGTQIDLVLKQTGEADFNWDAVWFGQTALNDSGWTAEMKIPLSQLRYNNNKPEQIWGMHSWRWIDRLQEEDQWSVIPRNNTGFIYNFGELHGIENLPKSRRIEFVPYIVGKLEHIHKTDNNPFTGKNNPSATFGADGKIGVGSDFTIDLTVNPDFGQVEADPSVMNLSVFETYYDEKRPFFLEGKSVFDDDMDQDLVFYSRRIGHTPLKIPDEDASNNIYVKSPSNTSIIDAVKFSGKSADGLSIGLLQSFTSSSYADVSQNNKISSVLTDPYTNYFVGRVQKDYNKGNTIIGAIATTTNRSIHNLSMDSLNKAAYTGGIDFQQYFFNRDYYITAKAIFSRVEGDTTAIQLLQQSATHYYQRPDANYLHYNSKARYMQGNGGSVIIGREGKNKLHIKDKFAWRSPGFDLNDIGYLRMADGMANQVIIFYHESEPKGFFREYTIYTENNNLWDYGNVPLDNNTMLDINASFKNKYFAEIWLNHSWGGFDTRVLRGGPALRFSPGWNEGIFINTDGSKKVMLYGNVNETKFDNGNSVQYNIHPGIGLRFGSKFTIKTEFGFTNNFSALQYVATPMDNQFIMAKLAQQTYAITFRFNLNLNSKLSIQYYGSPFVSSGNYTEFKQVTGSISKAINFNDRFIMINQANLKLSTDNSTYTLLDNNLTFSNPNFTMREFRSNLVARWEFRAGSALYLVWAYQMSATDQNYVSEYGSNLNTLYNLPADNIFMVKFNYYFSL
jgi:hypothetical protein